MSRPLVRRLTVLTAVGGCLAAAALPAVAQGVTEDVTVSYVAADGTRQFRVTELDGTTPLADFTFDSSLQKPFRTLVEDNGRLLDTAGYQVNAQLTNLYLAEGAGFDYASYIPSRNLSLTYGATPLAATSSLPVVPQVSLSGVIGTCADADVAAALGITALTSPLDAVGLSTILDPAVQSVCTQLGGLSEPARTVDAAVDGIVQKLSAPLALPDLPFALTGAQQAGAFTNPSFQGAIASADPAATGAAAATTKRIMTGTPLLSGGSLTGLLATLTGTLTTQLAAAPVVSDGGDGVATLNAALAAVSSENSALATAISSLDVSDQLALIDQLTPTLLDVTVDQLTSITAQYGAFPVLQANPLTTKAGTYNGTLIVDFFES